MNSYNPVKEQVQALDEYLNVAIWQNLMGEHQEDYLIHDFLMEEPNNTPTYRGFAYPHIYNTYFAMYKIAKQYPDLIDYIEDADTYLLRCYNIMDALYNEGTVGYNWATGLMGESTTPDIIEALQERGYEEEAANLTSIMEKKFQNFANDPYPYISEYPYDNTSEEAIYTLAKMFGNDSVMSKVNEKQEPAVVYSQSGIIMEIQPQSVVKTGSTSSILLLLQDIVWMTGFVLKTMA